MTTDPATTAESGRALHLVLCSDGTGNKAGSTPDTNVFKMYNAVDIHTDPDTDEAEQRTFYDVGVGTSAFAPWKAVSGAVGAGFGQNVRDLYRFLAKNYEPDPRTKIFVFGFSRGAATVRAFTGFLHACGLVDGRKMLAGDLQDLIDQQFGKYKSGETTGPPPKMPGVSHGRVPVHFVGVWDTVSALGAPKYGKPTGPLSWMMKQACVLIDNVVNLIHKHHSYQYGLNDEIKNAYQALAIDDERTSFRPKVWDERNVPDENVVEQVWFAGMHSNVGGGYERGGLADVALDWMMERADHHGLIFNVSDQRQIQNRANSLGLIRDSRAGGGILYRYHPRNITELCQDGLEKDKTKTPRIHKSVLDRMRARVDSYAPGYLPRSFNAVETTLASEGAMGVETPVEIDETGAPAGGKNWNQLTRRLKKGMNARKRLHSITMFTLLVVLGFGLFWWVRPPANWGRSGFFGHVADILDYVLPDLLGGLIEYTVVQNPIYLTVVAIVGLGLWIRRTRIVGRMRGDREDLRGLILEQAGQNRKADASSTGEVSS